jgi:hypothetical protein
MTNIFVSYTKSDRDWAFWIAQELLKLGHTPHVHEWEISAGGNIVNWMEKRLEEADCVLCVISEEYLNKSFSSWERRSGEWAAAGGRENFVLPVFVEDCEAPLLLAPLKRCDLFEIDEAEARKRLTEYLIPAGKTKGDIKFPDKATLTKDRSQDQKVAFPGRVPQSSSVEAEVSKVNQNPPPPKDPQLNSRAGAEIDSQSPIFSQFQPLAILREAISAVPSVRYALAVAGV